MTVIAPQAAGSRASVRADARDVVGTLLVGTAAGALAGLVIGGIAGRLVMLVLRVLSDPSLIGVTSDDGFEIGRVTLGGSFQLAGATAALGAANGVVYAVVRGAIPRRARALLWSSFAAAAGGSQFVHADGVDFGLLEPRWLAVVAFVVLPGLGALVIAVLVERWLREDDSCPPTAALVIAAAAGTVALVVAAAAAAAILLVRRLGLARALASAGRVVVPVAIVVGTAVGAWYTAVEAIDILG